MYPWWEQPNGFGCSVRNIVFLCSSKSTKVKACGALCPEKNCWQCQSWSCCNPHACAVHVSAGFAISKVSYPRACAITATSVRFGPVSCQHFCSIPIIVSIFKVINVFSGDLIFTMCDKGCVNRYAVIKIRVVYISGRFSIGEHRKGRSVETKFTRLMADTLEGDRIFNPRSLIFSIFWCSIYSIEAMKGLKLKIPDLNCRPPKYIPWAQPQFVQQTKCLHMHGFKLSRMLCYVRHLYDYNFSETNIELTYGWRTVLIVHLAPCSKGSPLCMSII